MAEPIVALTELSIELSNYCLLRCIHCSSGSQPIRQPDELKHHEIVRIIQEARALGATVLSLSGGDPIVYSGMQVFLKALMSESLRGHQRFLNATEYVALARELGYKRVLFYTTGVWSIDLEQLDMPGAEPLGALWGMDSWPHLDDLIDAGRDILTVIFSLDSHRPEVHDFIRGVSGAWYTTTGSVMALTSMGVNVEVHMVPMRPNYQHISNVRDLCAQMGVSKLSLLRFVPQTRGFDNLGLLDMGVEEFEDMQYIMEADADLSEGLYPHIVEMRPGCPIDFRHTIGATAHKMKSCHAGLDLILVRPDGSVHPCAAWKTLPNSATIRDASLEYIWENAITFCALREFHTVGYKRLPAPCGTCVHLDSCKGGCPAQRLHVHGKTWEDVYYPASDPLCPIGAI